MSRNIPPLPPCASYGILCGDLYLYHIRVLSLAEGQGMKLITYLHLVPRLRVSEAIPLFPDYAFIAWAGTNLPSYFLHPHSGDISRNAYIRVYVQFVCPILINNTQTKQFNAQFPSTKFLEELLSSSVIIQ
jgi:hypothetical protein